MTYFYFLRIDFDDFTITKICLDDEEVIYHCKKLKTKSTNQQEAYKDIPGPHQKVPFCKVLATKNQITLLAATNFRSQFTFFVLAFDIR